MTQEKQTTAQDKEQSCACCSIESVLTLDERGMVCLPKDIRNRAGLNPGDKIALISWEKEDKICCFSMVPVRELSGTVGAALGPLMNFNFNSGD